MGVPCAGIDRDMFDIRQLGYEMSQDKKVVPIEEILNHFHAHRYRPSYDWSCMLCIPTDQTKLSYSSLYLAYGDGIGHSLPATKPENFFAEMLAFSFIGQRVPSGRTGVLHVILLK